MKNILTLLLILSLSSLVNLALADDWPDELSFSIESYHKGIADTKAAAEYALTKRGWSITSRTASDYDAIIKKRNIDAKIRLEIDDSKVVILSNSQQYQIVEDFSDIANSAYSWRPYYPKGWIRNIEKDIKTFLATRPAITAEESIESRLEKLKAIYSKNLISEHEYEKKRLEILDSL